MHIAKKQIETIKDHNFTKELKKFEYETKFDIKDVSSGSFGILKMIRGCFDENGRYILVKIGRGDRLLTRVEFFTYGDTEYSVFRYRGARMVKVKKHRIVKAEPFSIFKNDESLVIDRSDFSRKLVRSRHRFKRHNYRLVDLGVFLKSKNSMISVGEMIKERVKDFVIDSSDGRIYAVAVTFCKTKDKVQKQLEIEYSGYLSGFRRKKGAIEKEVITGTLSLSKYIYDHFPTMFKSSTERKFDFVKINN